MVIWDGRVKGVRRYGMGSRDPEMLVAIRVLTRGSPAGAASLLGP